MSGWGGLRVMEPKNFLYLWKVLAKAAGIAWIDRKSIRGSKRGSSKLVDEKEKIELWDKAPRPGSQYH